MNAKLTLKLNKDAIRKAKIFAKKQHTSLSNLVENYFNFIGEKVEKKNLEVSHLVKELSGIIHIDELFNYKKEYTDYLIEKYK